MRLRGLPLLVTVLTAGVAHAQSTAPLTFERFNQTFNGKGIFSTESADTLEQWKPAIGFMLHYQRDPMRQAGTRLSYLSQRLTGDFALAFGLLRWLEVGIGVPIAFINDKGTGEGAAGGLLGPGPMRFELKLRALNEADHGIGMAFQFGLAVPVGAIDAFLSENGAVFSPSVIFEKHLTPNHRILANIGYNVRKEAKYRTALMDDEVWWRVGYGWTPNDRVEIGAEVTGATLADDMFSKKSQGNPVEALFGFRYKWSNGASWVAGWGPGLNVATGTPTWRAFTGLSYSPTSEKDTDGDGVIDRNDRCPNEPGPRENQGCPWPDSDKDGILDKDDKCPNQPGPKENNGCPWPDSDGDGVLDKDDKCPNEKGPADNNGCPVKKAEPPPPPKDSDGDGIPDDKDECPNQPGVAAKGGCPEKGPAITKSDIKFEGRIQFATGSASIKNKKSKTVIDEVAELLKKYPQIKKVEVGGHTDDVGDEDANRKLAQKRAETVVKRLIKDGVEATRLVAKGYGEDKPLVQVTKEMSKKDKAAARKQNRRVEFHILEKE